MDVYVVRTGELNEASSILAVCGSLETARKYAWEFMAEPVQYPWHTPTPSESRRFLVLTGNLWLSGCDFVHIAAYPVIP